MSERTNERKIIKIQYLGNIMNSLSHIYEDVERRFKLRGTCFYLAQKICFQNVKIKISVKLSLGIIN
jgi:hypothetical protein